MRTNLMSALPTVLAASLVYAIVLRTTPRRDGIPAWPGALAAGFAFGLSPLVWSQAIITEVYALQGLLVALIIYFYVLPDPASPSRKRLLDGWRGLLLGLSAANHSTALILAPVALLLGSFQRVRKKEDRPGASHPWFKNIAWNWAALSRQVLFFGVGLSVYLLLPLRALARPPVNWGDPATWKGFWWLVSAQLYRAYYLPANLAGLWERTRALTGLFWDQFGLLGLLFGFAGLVVFWRSSRLYIFMVWIALVSAIFALVYRASDSYVYLLPGVIAFAIWIGLGVSGLARVYRARFSSLGVALGLLVALNFLARVPVIYPYVDASTDARAEEFAQGVLDAAPRDALILARGDEAVFTLWYYHFALGERPDLAVIASDLLGFDWYQDSLRSAYPDLVLTGPLPIPERLAFDNPTRPACFVESANRAEIDCLSQPASP